ncbi:MAG: ATP synthase subunit I [Gracilibacteraceae bacterium]|jgi:hypothetical protein|nr:ATP synthase subunit I [Gracilibacteraceae bacterium]
MSLKQVFLTEAAVLLCALALTLWRGDVKFVGLFAGCTVGVLNHLLLRRDMLQTLGAGVDRAVIRYVKGLLTRLALITAAVALCARVLPEWTFPMAGGLAFGIVISLALAAVNATRGNGSFGGEQSPPR